MRICYVPYTGFVGGAPTYYRLVFPFRELEKRGHWARTPVYEIVENVKGESIYLFDCGRLPTADVYVFQMPLDRAMVSVIRAVRLAGKVSVCEADDSDLIPEWHPALEATKSEGNPLRSREWRRRCFQACDAVTVSTPALAREWSAWKHPGQIHVLPNFLLGEMWAGAGQQHLVDRGGRVRVGWMGRSDLRLADLEVLREVVPEVLAQNEHVDFVAAGDGLVHELIGVPPERRVSLPPVRFPKGLVDLTASMDVGLVPLARSTPVDSHFNDCKSHLKGMEYNACGIPYVASPSEPYRAYTQPGRNGFLAATSDEWVEHISRLVTDHELRRNMGEQSRVVAGENCIEDHAHLWEDCYQGLIDRKDRMFRKDRIIRKEKVA